MTPSILPPAVAAACERVKHWLEAVESNRNFGAFPSPMIKSREVSKAEEVVANHFLAIAPLVERLVADLRAMVRNCGRCHGMGEYLVTEQVAPNHQAARKTACPTCAGPRRTLGEWEATFNGT